MTTCSLPFAAAVMLAVSLPAALAQPASARAASGASATTVTALMLTREPRAQRRIGSALAAAGVTADASARCETETKTETEAADETRVTCRRKLAQAGLQR